MNKVEKIKIPYVHVDAIHNTNAAQAFVPYLFEFITPTSVLDVGCGTGTWLYVLNKLGVEKIVGIDGEYVNINQLHISPTNFIGADLCKEINLQTKFDLVVSLEVAEHLPETASNNFVNTLTNHSDVILFSAALPSQGGQNHLNEQKFSYWVEKFAVKGYIFVDAFRNRIWNEDSIDWWYRQNAFLVVKKGHPLLEKFDSKLINDFYHPELYRLILKDRDSQVEIAKSFHSQYQSVMNGDSGVYQSIKILVKAVIKFFKIK